MATPRLTEEGFQTLEMELVYLMFLHARNGYFYPGTMQSSLFSSPYWNYLSVDSLPDWLFDHQLDRFLAASMIGCLTLCLEDLYGTRLIEGARAEELLLAVESFTADGISSDCFECDEKRFERIRVLILVLLQDRRKKTAGNPAGDVSAELLSELHWVYNAFIAHFFLNCSGHSCKSTNEER